MCQKKEKRKPTHTYTTLTLTKKGRIWAAPHGWAPRTLVVCMKPESRGADKMWNSWRGTGGKVSNKYLHMWRLEGGGGSQTFSCPGPPKWTHQTSVPLFPHFFKSAQAHVRAFYSSSSSYNYYYWCNFLNDTLHVKYIHHFLNTNKL